MIIKIKTTPLQELKPKSQWDYLSVVIIGQFKTIVSSLLVIQFKIM